MDGRVSYEVTSGHVMDGLYDVVWLCGYLRSTERRKGRAQYVVCTYAILDNTMLYH